MPAGEAHLLDELVSLLRILLQYQAKCFQQLHLGNSPLCIDLQFLQLLGHLNFVVLGRTKLLDDQFLQEIPVPAECLQYIQSLV